MTWQLHLQADDELRLGLQAYAKAHGLPSIAAAVRFIVIKELKEEADAPTGEITRSTGG